VYVGTSHDITELRTAHRQLQTSHRERRTLMTQLLHAEDRERRRIALDVHDDPIQALTGLQLELSVLQRRAEGSDLLPDLEEVERAVAECITRMRHLVFELHPRSLDEPGGLGATLRQLVANVETASETEGRFRDLTLGEPDELGRGVVYRAALQALANARRHARAHTIGVTLAEVDGGFLLTVRDDGVGFDPTKVGAQEGHLGLAGMRERAEGIGGWLRITSAEGFGATVEAWVPATSAASYPGSSR
jgi:signal transduction histidine kinase